MAKRRLTRQQRRRIAQQQRAHQTRAREQSSAPADSELGPEQQGLVIACYGAQLEIEGADGNQQRCFQRANLGSVVTGDRVVWRAGADAGVVVARLERSSELCRPDSRGQLRPVAANIDRLVVVIAPLPAPHANLIDRYLVAAHAAGIEPLLLLNKTDLLAGDAGRELEDLLQSYAELGYTVLRACATEAGGIDALTTALRGRCAALVGQSGVGKSSLVSALLPEEAVRIGALSAEVGKGTHTTTTARLYHLPGGGELIDSPGIREFGLVHLDADTVAAGFVEFRPFLGHCRFRDCRHGEEPGCALREALARGTIDPRRFASYESIRQSQD